MLSLLSLLLKISGWSDVVSIFTTAKLGNKSLVIYLGESNEYEDLVEKQKEPILLALSWWTALSSHQNVEFIAKIDK